MVAAVVCLEEAEEEHRRMTASHPAERDESTSWEHQLNRFHCAVVVDTAKLAPSSLGIRNRPTYNATPI